MSDVEIRKAIAIASGWKILREGSNGELIARIPGILTAFPYRVPHWTSNPDDISDLEAGLEHRGLRPQYTERLTALGHAPSVRERAEAALETLLVDRR